MAILLGGGSFEPRAGQAKETAPAGEVAGFVSQYCAGCHNADKKKGELDLEQLCRSSISAGEATWEKVVRRLATRQMPPPERKRPDEADYRSILAAIEGELDRAASDHPNPGRTDTLRRLNRTEYHNSIRDLLGLEIDTAALLPKDESGHGFDNVTVGDLSPTLLNRYIAAAEKISQLAVGTGKRVGGDTIRVKADLTQEGHVEGLPVGTRGGVLIEYNFPQDAEYDLQIRLTRDRNEDVEGLKEEHQLDLLIDDQAVQSFTVAPPKDRNFEKVDQHLKARVPVKAGSHRVGITFLANPAELIETKRQPYNAHFNTHRHPRQNPAVYQVSINGPYNAKGSGDTLARRRLFVCNPSKRSDEDDCARLILSSIARKAYRRPVSNQEIGNLLEFYRTGKNEGGFEQGIQAALAAVLVSPNFLFRVEHDPAGATPKSAYALSDLELASRISFFLWSSIPDEELLDLARRGELHRPDVLEAQARRMLADSRSESLATNFASQWLYLRNLESFTPDLRQFLDFDDNLRQAFREETERFFGDVLTHDRSALTLLKADYTFLNERLAKHYGIAHVYGSRFRRVSIDSEDRRGGLLRQGSILTVTSYATRTSPVLRGHWILKNLVGTPPPPPPPNVPALKDNTISAQLSIRQRLAEHRANVACAGCHNAMDPVGFALENYDAVGRWREVEDGNPIDTSGGLPDGTKFSGVIGLEDGLLRYPEVFIGTLTEKLLTFALGRGVEPFDGPAIRKIVREARDKDYRLSAVILGVIKSVPFTMRQAE